MTLRERIEALPVHQISGYEWDCYTGPASPKAPWSLDGKTPCPEVNPDLSHEQMLDRDAVLALLDSE